MEAVEARRLPKVNVRVPPRLATSLSQGGSRAAHTFVKGANHQLWSLVCVPYAARETVVMGVLGEPSRARSDIGIGTEIVTTSKNR